MPLCHHAYIASIGFGQYNSIGTYCGPHTAYFVHVSYCSIAESVYYNSDIAWKPILLLTKKEVFHMAGQLVRFTHRHRPIP